MGNILACGFPVIDRLQVKTPQDHQKEGSRSRFGGGAYNVAVSTIVCGGKSAFFGPLPLGSQREFLKALRGHGIQNLSIPTIVPVAEFIVTSSTFNLEIRVRLPEESISSIKVVGEQLESIRDWTWAMVSPVGQPTASIIEEVFWYQCLLWAKESGMRVAFDLGSPYHCENERYAVWAALKSELIDLLFGTHEEFEALKSSAQSVAEIIMRKCSKEVVVIEKFGREGIRLYNGSDFLHVESAIRLPLKKIIGAGDFIAAAYLLELVQGSLAEEAANVALEKFHSYAMHCSADNPFLLPFDF